MAPLHENLRRLLEKTVLSARTVAETGARAALERLTVGRPEPGSHLKPEERALRLRLRAKGRHAGDTKRGDEQTIDHLVAEAAYEHWHRMLFARFLDENHLLINPDGVSVTLEECQELAHDEGASNGWELASRYASAMLPEIFRVDDPVLALSLAPEHRVALEKLLEELPREVFTADDSLGWVYQFWQAQKKDEVNKSGNKIGADELPAVTQLFTEHYMVSFLLHNSLGAWWAGQHLPKDGKTRSEEELRECVALPGYRFDYLRFLLDGTAAAGTFEEWPKTARELKVLDPCTGSGHFLTAAFEILVRMRMAEEGISPSDACAAVLRDNIHGLELDPRCTQIAAFNLALAAWKYPGADGYRPLPALHIACCGLAPRAKREDWQALAAGDERLRAGMERLFDLFQLAPELGSLIDPTRGSNPMFEASFAELQPLLDRALDREKNKGSVELEAAGVVAQGLAKAATLLAGKYNLVATNVPYLARSKQSESLQAHCEKWHEASKANLATTFVDRAFSMLDANGCLALVSLQTWLFQVAYKDMRAQLLSRRRLSLAAPLGMRAFQTQMWDFATCLLLLGNDRPDSNHEFCYVQECESSAIVDIMNAIRRNTLTSSNQFSQIGNPDAVIMFSAASKHDFTGKHCSCCQGIKTGDDGWARRQFWEVREVTSQWRYLQSTVSEHRDFGGLEYIVNWAEDGQRLARKQGQAAWGRKGVAISQMASLPCTFYLGEPFDSNMAALVPHNPSDLPALTAFCFSQGFPKQVRTIDQALKPTNSTFEKLAFDFLNWNDKAKRDYPNGIPTPYSDDPTQWIFHGHPCGAVVWNDEAKRLVNGPLRTDGFVLQTAVTRLLGYRWPAEIDDKIELSKESGEWVKKTEALLSFADDDGVVCIPPVGGEQPAAERLRAILAASYGKEWLAAREQELLASVGYPGKTLENWLRDGFFEQHFKLFQHRPFIWQIWDGRRDGFSALVHYHRLNHKLLERITYTYLGGWLKRQEDGVARDEAGAESRLIAAQQLQGKLKLILEGEAPYDIFVRWKPLHEQPIGWDPDLNDGVRLNIRPFMTAEVLRKRPNIKWEKDRGKDAESAPWFKVFKGERINDHHLSLAEKRAARERAKGKK